MSWITTSTEYCSSCKKETVHINGFCQEKHREIKVPMKLTIKGKNNKRRILVYDNEPSKII